MKKMISKLSKIRRMGFALMVAVALVSCDKEEGPTQEPEFTQEELAEMAAVEKFAAANSVYRALALIDELPDNWESATYTPAEGVPVDEANSDIRNVVSTGADHAKQYFLSIVPDKGLNGDTWSHEGVGTLTFRAMNEENCYAVIDVNLVQMPGLTQLRFVPETVVGENSFSGTPYYRVGDVIKDKKKGIYWICVRPAGGPLKKDYAYFVSFDKSLIKTTEHKQDIYEVDDDNELTKTKIANISKKWTFAKNLVEERIAIAAGHTFAMFVGAMNEDAPLHYEDFKGKALELQNNRVIDFSKLVGKYAKDAVSINQVNSFNIAYGSYVKNQYTDVRQEKYLQPIMTVAHQGLDDGNFIKETVTKVWYDRSPENINEMIPTPYLLSLTTDYDPLSFNKFVSYFEWTWEESYQVPFHINSYTTTYQGRTSEFTMPLCNYLHGVNDLYVMVMTQMSLKDHGKANSSYELVYKRLEDEMEPDYWTSLILSHRYYFDEGMNNELVEGDLE